MTASPDGEAPRPAPPRGEGPSLLGEGLAAILAAGLGFALLPGPTAAAGAVLAVAAVTIAGFDRRFWIIPDTAVAVLLVVGFAAALLPARTVDRADLALDAATRAAVAGGFFWALRAVFRLWRGIEGLGLGDVKLAAAGAVWLPWNAMLPALEAAVGGALVVALFGAWRAGRRPRGDEALPFGVFLAPAIWLAWLAAATGLLDRLAPFGFE